MGQDTDRVGERRSVGVVVVVGGGVVVGAESAAAIGHPVAPVVVGAHGPAAMCVFGSYI